MKSVIEINRWYDNIKEPYRFLFFMSVIIPGYTALFMGKGIVAPLGAAYLLSLGLLRWQSIKHSRDKT